MSSWPYWMRWSLWYSPFRYRPTGCGCANKSVANFRISKFRIKKFHLFTGHHYSQKIPERSSLDLFNMLNLLVWTILSYRWSMWCCKQECTKISEFWIPQHWFSPLLICYHYSQKVLEKGVIGLFNGLNLLIPSISPCTSRRGRAGRIFGHFGILNYAAEGISTFLYASTTVRQPLRTVSGPYWMRWMSSCRPFRPPTAGCPPAAMNIRKIQKAEGVFPTFDIAPHYS